MPFVFYYWCGFLTGYEHCSLSKIYYYKNNIYKILINFNNILPQIVPTINKKVKTKIGSQFTTNFTTYLLKNERKSF